MEDQKLPDGRFLLLAWKPGSPNQFALVAVDPVTKSIARFETTPPLPADDTASFWGHSPVVDRTGGRIHLLAAVPPYGSPGNYRIYTVDIATGTLNGPTGAFTLPPSTNNFTWEAGTFLPEGSLAAGGRLFFTGGTANGENGGAHPHSWFAEPILADPAPQIRAEPIPLLFGKVRLGKSLAKLLAIHNDGDAPLAVTRLTKKGNDFTLVAPPSRPFSVTPGGVRKLKVRFSPAARGLRSGWIRITHNDPASGAVTVPLKGTGVK